MGRADRIFLLIFFPLIHLIIFFFIPGGDLGLLRLVGLESVSLTVLDLLMIIFIIGGNLTAIQRAISIWKTLSKKQEAAQAKAVDAASPVAQAAQAPTRKGKKKAGTKARQPSS